MIDLTSLNAPEFSTSKSSNGILIFVLVVVGVMMILKKIKLNE